MAVYHELYREIFISLCPISADHHLGKFLKNPQFIRNMAIAEMQRIQHCIKILGIFSISIFPGRLSYQKNLTWAYVEYAVSFYDKTLETK